MAVSVVIRRGLPEVAGVDLTAMDPGGTWTDVNGLTVPTATGAGAGVYVPLTAAMPVIGSVQKGTAGAAAPDQVLQTFSSSGGVSIASGANVALFTVPTGKTLFITDIIITGNAATAGQVLCQLKQASTVIWEAFMKTDTQPIEIPSIETQPSAPSGSAVSLVIGTLSGGTAAYYIAGYTQ